jgi:hypothetical protein
VPQEPERDAAENGENADGENDELDRAGAAIFRLLV